MTAERRYKTPRHTWERLRKMAAQGDQALKGGMALIWLDMLSEMDRKYAETLAREQVNELFRKANAEESAENKFYRQRKE